MAYKYKAFISYAHADKAWARMLHLRLETFSTPKALVGKQGRHGEIEKNLHPVFRDRDELPTGSALGPELQRALEGSEFLLVLCSPASANSRWVNEEIRSFRKTHGDDRILAAIVDGDPAAPVGKGEAGCFPPALTEPPEGETTPREPIAADFRETGDGKKLAFMKVASGLLGIGLDDLVQRAAQRRQRRMTQIAAASLAGMALTSGLAVVAVNQSIEANKQRAIAEEERDTTGAALDFLVSTFEIANPATENANNITARMILDRGTDKIESELAGKPQVQAKLMATIGDIYANLNVIEEAETLLNEAIALPETSREDRLTAKLRLANLYFSKSEYQKTLTLAEEVETELAEDIASKEPEINDPHGIRGRVLEMRALKAYGDKDTPRAVEIYQQAKDEFAKSLQDHGGSIARINTNQGMMLGNIGEHERADASLAAAYGYFTSRYGANHLKSAISLHNWAYSDFNAGDVDAGIEKMHNAIDAYNEVLEPNHEKLANAWLALGRMERKKNAYEDAAASYKKAAIAFEAVYGPDHQMLGRVFADISQIQAEDKKIESAFESFSKARRVYDANFPPGHVKQGDLRIYEAIILNAAGRKEEAIKVCAEGMAIIENGSTSERFIETNRAICEKFG